MSTAQKSTAVLLERIRAGDDAAKDRLLARYLEPLQRWAAGRLPRYARDSVDTNDLVQVTFLRALNRLEDFEPRHDGAFLAYLRRILLNCIRDEIRRSVRHPAVVELPAQQPSPGVSPLEEAIGAEALARYESALAALSDRQQEAVILRLELGFSHGEVAEAIGAPSPDAARMTVVRGVERLAGLLEEGARSP